MYVSSWESEVSQKLSEVNQSGRNTQLLYIYIYTIYPIYYNATHHAPICALCAKIHSF